ncbi:hypothetical protein IDAT_10270 [Pseudidiomarina atlantica]|uniref:Uncharacterized protein n=1 Tax=Pseudidiomarina atlantica TaxID=1517416 RepID=A0A094L0T6_9GAMM|nr:hypothetical protein [Pseudidiomarina atlantica]KFZ28213.1 hypothetical protein IDAT_10270 [Pseudidiomarina atlantica]
MKLRNLVLFSTLVLSPALVAQEVTVRIDADFSGGRGTNFLDYWSDATSGSVWITYDTSVTPLLKEGNNFRYEGAIKSMRFELYEFGTGEVMDIGVPTEVVADNSTTGNQFYTYRFIQEFNGQDEEFMNVVSRVLYSSETSVGYMSVIASEYPALDLFPLPLFADYSAFPVWNTYETESNYLNVVIDHNQTFESLSFRIQRISYLAPEIADADGDGVADDVDSCPMSLTDETVSFSGFDSSVTNYVRDNGCTIMDTYAACTANASVEETSSRFGAFQPRLSGPSYCETQVSYQLVDEGIIDYTEARMLRDTLYMSYRSSSR